MRFLLLILLLSFFNCLSSEITTATKKYVQCVSKEREALLQIKHAITKDYGRLTSWGHQDADLDCCQWYGVQCSNQTGHVVMLDLYCNDPSVRLEGNMTSSLGELKYLEHLDLSLNSFQGRIPDALGDLHALSYLNLQSNNLEGPIPDMLGGLRNLSYLALPSNQLQGPIPTTFGNMSSLSYLDLSGNQLEGSIPEAISNLKLLTHLDLSSNRLTIYQNMRGISCSLQTLDLSYNNLSDELSGIIQNLFGGCTNKSLEVLRLGGNQISGSVPDMIGTFSSLTELSLDYNQLNGTISPSIGQLAKLETLSLSNNFLKGTLSHHHLSNLSSLLSLVLSGNSELVVNISSDWIPPFQLRTIDLYYTKLGPHFPKWLLTQTMFFSLDISNAGISDTIPPSFWKSLPQTMHLLNMSSNMIHGRLPNVSVATSFIFPATVDLSSNYLRGAIPSFLGQASVLLLQHNNFSDLSPLLCTNTSAYLNYLDVSSNSISGKLPDCWMHSNLGFLFLQNNKISGSLPASIGMLKQLTALHLRNNSLSGELPKSLENCTSLVILDLSHNSLTGFIPVRIGNSLGSLAVLSLGSNHISGSLPSSLCRMSNLQILDLSVNNFSGTIPTCIYNLSAMINGSLNLIGLNFYSSHHFEPYYDVTWIRWKKREWSFQHSLPQLKGIDISDNKLEGQIPEQISSLIGLMFLNVSRNHFNGSITPKLQELTSLEILDASNNHLSGQIPSSLASLNFLEILDLSNNSLSGKIPLGTQMQSFGAAAYMGNPGLCGDPLPNKCASDQSPTRPMNGDNTITQHDENDSDGIYPGLYISVVLGVIVGFWGVCGTLVIKRSWRRAYFRFLNDTKDKLYVMVVLNIARVRRNH